MAKLPEPPSPEQLVQIGAAVHFLPANTILGRIYFASGNFPTQWDSFRYWGPTTSRFDHHTPDDHGKAEFGDRGIYYAATASPHGALLVCLAEVFQATRHIDITDREPHFVLFETQRPLRLLDLRGLWPTRAGASSAINSGPKKRVQRWSRAIYAAWSDIDGVIYPSSMGGNGDAIALYERSRNAFPSEPKFNRALQEPSLMTYVVNAAADINYLVS